MTLTHKLALPGAILFTISAAPAAVAQDNTASPATAAAMDSEFEALKACRAIAADAERLACFDRTLSVVVAAEESGDLRVVDKEQAQKTRRKLFGFSLPDLGIFGGEDDDAGEDDLFQTTITSARRLSSKRWTFTTAEGAVWQINDAPRRLRSIKEGQSVEFKEASLGTFFIRINGQMGVKGRRIR